MRDLCVGGAWSPLHTISASAFDPYTGALAGELVSPDSPPDSPPDSCTIDNTFDEPCVGTMGGAKPLPGQCVAVKDTWKEDVTSGYHGADVGLAFTYFLNTDAVPTLNYQELNTPGWLPNYYNQTKSMPNAQFFIGGSVAACDAVLTLTQVPPTAVEATRTFADFWHANQDYCAAEFIWKQSIEPWFRLERPGLPGSPDFGTYNPLSKVTPDLRGPLALIANSCQVLGAGDKAKNAPLGTDMRTLATGAPAWSLKKPSILAALYDEGGEYMPSTDAGWIESSWHESTVIGMLQRDNGGNYWSSDEFGGRWGWDAYFHCPGGSYPCDIPNPFYLGQPYKLTEYIPNPFVTEPPIEVPCVQELGVPDAPGPITYPSPLSETTPIPPTCSAPPETAPQQGPETAPETPACGNPGPPGDYEWQPVPTHLIPGSQSEYWCPNVEAIFDPQWWQERLDFSGDDRDTYSPDTDITLYNPLDNCAETLGYTDYNQHPLDWQHLNEWPVTGALVPVDLLNTRYDAFQSCIMQRINWNIQAFVKLWEEDGVPPPQQTAADAAEYGNGGTVDNPQLNPGGTFWPPCATRFWETDTCDECPVKLSIQQCFHIIIKDLVPYNYVKLRTCEGLRDARIYNAGVTEGGSPVANILDQDYALQGSTPKGANQYFSTQYDFPIDKLYQQIICVDEKLTQYNCTDTEPQPYAFRNAPGIQAYSDQNPNRTCDGDPLIGYHMPYYRWWDTGISADDSGNRVGQNGQPLQPHGGSFINTLGGWDVIPGTPGREERGKWEAQQLASHLPQGPENQLPSELQQPQPAQGSRVYSSFGNPFTELNSWQAFVAWRRENLMCIGRYDILGKPGGPEDSVLNMAGWGYSTLGGYVQVKGQQLFIPSVQQPWPLGWRKYVTDTHGDVFPTNDQNYTNAQPGDIVRYMIDTMPQLAYVVTVTIDSNPDPTQQNSSVSVLNWDSGKFPTSSGSSILDWGQSASQGFRTIWQHGVPLASLVNNSGSTPGVLQHTLMALTSTNPAVADLCSQLDPGIIAQSISNVAAAEGACIDPNSQACLIAVQQTWQTCQTSCDDPQARDCILPPEGGQDQWVTGLVYHPAIDMAGRQCGPDITQADMLLQQIPTNVWASCVAWGYDPNLRWLIPGGYNGPGTGAITKSALCGKGWASCLSYTNCYTWFTNNSASGPDCIGGGAR
jgi:hypothetical protein